MAASKKRTSCKGRKSTQSSWSKAESKLRRAEQRFEKARHSVAIAKANYEFSRSCEKKS